MTDVDVLTGEIVPEVSPLTSAAARELTERIADGLGDIWQLVKKAYEGRAWAALGYGTWDEYLGQEFGKTRISLPREDRPEIVASLRESGLSIRAIASATGASVGTVHSDLAGVQNRTPDGPTTPDLAPPIDDEPDAPPATVTGLDGRKHPAKKPAAPPQRSPLEDLYANDDTAMKRMLHKKLTTALVGFAEPRKWDPARIAASLPDRDNQRVIDLIDSVEAWLADYRAALNGDVRPLRSVK